MSHEAEKKFWWVPELTETVLPFLDSYSTIQLAKVGSNYYSKRNNNDDKLAQAHRLTRDIVLGDAVWNKLISRKCLFKKDFVQNRIQVEDIVQLLKSLEDPLPHLRDLLDLICKIFPPTPQNEEDGFVRVSCPRRGSCLVLDTGFQLLETAEAALGSTEQRLELVLVDYLGNHLLADVASRLARQRINLDISETRVEVWENLICKNQEDVKAISSLMQNCQSVHIHGSLFIPDDIGRKGWAALGQALSCKLQDVPRIKTLDKSCMASADRKDLRAIWECLSLSWEICVARSGLFEKHGGEDAWQKLEQFLDLTDEEWHAIHPICVDLGEKRAGSSLEAVKGEKK